MVPEKGGEKIMAYATLIDFRAHTPFSKNEIKDADVTILIPHADRAIIQAITVEAYLEKLSGSINGTNKEFKVKHSPIADSDADSDIDKDDVEVYYATLSSAYTQRNKDYGSAVTVDTVEADNGLIYVATAPTQVTAEAGVYATYRWKKLGTTNYSDLELASVYFLAYLAAAKISGNAPDYKSLDSRVREDVVGADWLKLCQKILNLQQGSLFKRIEHPKTV